MKINFKYIVIVLLLFAFNSDAQKVGEQMRIDERKDFFLPAPVVESKPFRKPNNLINVQGDRIFNNWGIEKLGIDKLMKLYNGEGITTCVCDTGVPNHPDLKEYISAEVNTSGSRKNDDLNGHSTHVGGIIAEILPKGKIVFVKVLSASGGGTQSDINNGIDSCIAHKTDIINLSVGSRSEHKPTEETINRAIAAGIVVVAAVGNDGMSESMDKINFPAALDTVIAVGSIDSNMNVSPFSSSGQSGIIMASGGNIMSTWKRGRYMNLSGTSMATPTAVGGIGLLIQHYRKLGVEYTPYSIKQLLINTATDIHTEGFDKQSFYGVANFADAARQVFKEAEVIKETKEIKAASTEGVPVEDLTKYKWWVYVAFGLVLFFAIVWRNFKR